MQITGNKYPKIMERVAMGQAVNPSAKMLLILRPNSGLMGRKYRALVPSSAQFYIREHKVANIDMTKHVSFASMLLY
jgi:hypothetical protein